MKPVKSKKIRFTPNGFFEPYPYMGWSRFNPVKAEIINLFAVTKESPNTYKINHIASGYSICKATLEDARNLAKFLSGGQNFDNILNDENLISALYEKYTLFLAMSQSQLFGGVITKN